MKEDHNKEEAGETEASQESAAPQTQHPDAVPVSKGHTLELVLNDRLGKKLRLTCNSDDTIGDVKKVVAATTGSRAEKIRIQKWNTVFKDHITLEDYEVSNGSSLELYYN